MNDSAQEHRPRRWLIPAALGVALVVGGLIGGGIVAATSSSGGGSSSSSAGACPVSSVADRVIPSVVTIAAGGPTGSGTGSGEVIRSDGYILTNNHVILPGVATGSVEVQFADGQSAKATITGRDPLTDLAVIRVEGSHGLKPIPFGASGSVVVGQQVVVIGSPLGLSGTVTSGIVSALDRTIEVPGQNDRSALLVSALQTDAAINPGNSGGSMVDCKGDLIGVPTAGATVPSASNQSTAGSIGLGFAIPVDLATSIADEIIATGRVTHAFFGLTTTPVVRSGSATPAGSSQGAPSTGLLVQGVSAGGPAQQAGLRAGDVITTIDGHPATSNIQLAELTITKRPGDTVAIGYLRPGASAETPTETTVTLAAQP